MKRMIALILCLALCFSCVGVSCCAAQVDTKIELRNLPLVLTYNASISISGSTASISSYLLCKPETTGCAITVYLQRAPKNSTAFSNVGSPFRSSVNTYHTSLTGTAPVSPSTYDYRIFAYFSAVKSNLGSDYKERYAYA